MIASDCPECVAKELTKLQYIDATDGICIQLVQVGETPCGWQAGQRAFLLKSSSSRAEGCLG